MTTLLNTAERSRKRLLTGGGALVLGLAGGGVGRGSNNPTAVSPGHLGLHPGPPDPNQIDSWLQVNPDNTVTLFHGWVEMGQGSPTAVRMIAAEELGLSMEQVTAVQLDTNVVVSAFAADSSSTRAAMAATSLRGAAAAARTVLVNMAAAHLGVPASALKIENGVASAGGRSVAYGALMAGKTFDATIAAVDPVLTDPSRYRLIGKRVPRIDIPAIVTGTGTYTQNVRVPGMLHGRVVRPRGQAAQVAGAKLLSFDRRSIAHIPDVQVVQKGNFLGVIAPLEYNAIQAAAQLKVSWAEAPTLSGDGNLESALRDPANLQRSAPAVSLG